MPDITTSEGLLRPLAREKSPRLIRVCKEDEGIGICAGLAHCNKRGLLLIQQTGMLDSINAMRGVAVEIRAADLPDGGPLGEGARRPPGSLVSIAEAAPRNLIHFVCENGTYEANGGHPIPNRGRVDFAGFAQSAGYRSTHTFSELKMFEQQVGAVLAEEGPVLATLKVTPSGPQKRDYSLLHGPAVRAATKAALLAR